MKLNKWLRIAIVFLSIIAISYGLAYLLQHLMSPLQDTLDKFAWLVYSGIFVISLLGSLTIIAPVPIATAVMIALATKWNPILLSFFASLGGTFGEISGYYAGYLGGKIAISENMKGYHQVMNWINTHGLWAIIILAFLPVLPYNVAGLVGGAANMPLKKFMPALWVGKFPKFIILCYAGLGLIYLLPS